ncbi:hypothetical protein LGK95_19710 [Clostridium algoriphilum]|uniref:hypothetical protein n=1 Tax=Clostridium algoriphilum TaxID=198347 RepID=UPI001CF0E4B7|nr:hypothetical protein [Clostridium algoriphilum]MCB2295706.1 hypothetical protein [Clostridium algoriphilum]
MAGDEEQFIELLLAEKNEIEELKKLLGKCSLPSKIKKFRVKLSEIEAMLKSMEKETALAPWNLGL